MPSPSTRPDTIALAAKVRLLCLDVDGVMTDGSIHLDDDGIETNRFHVRDGTAIKIWRRLGYETAIITGRSGRVVEHRARELGITHIIQGADDKGAALRDISRATNIGFVETAVLADDLPDLPMLRLCGYPMAVADAAAEIRDLAIYTTHQPGGHAAVREAVEHLLHARGRWAEAVKLFDQDNDG